MPPTAARLGVSKMQFISIFGQITPHKEHTEEGSLGKPDPRSVTRLTSRVSFVRAFYANSLNPEQVENCCMLAVALSQAALLSLSPCPHRGEHGNGNGKLTLTSELSSVSTHRPAIRRESLCEVGGMAHVRIREGTWVWLQIQNLGLGKL